MGLGQFCWVRRRSYVKEKSSSSANSTPIPQFSLPNSNVTQGSKGTHGQLYCPSLLFPGLLQKYTTSWGGKAYSGLEWAMGRSKQQLLGQSSFVHFSFFLFLHMENLIEVTHRSRTSWMPGQKCHWSRPITMAQSLPHPPLLQPLWARSRHQQTQRTNGPGLHIFLLFGWFFVSVWPKKKNHPPVCSIACVFLLYISLMNSPITNLNQMSKR